LVFDQPFFNEFYVKYDGDVDTLYQRFVEAGFLVAKLEDGLVFAVTEKRTKEEIDNLVKIAAL
jgi:glycine dehydrogenase subunit 1